MKVVESELTDHVLETECNQSNWSETLKINTGLQLVIDPPPDTAFFHVQVMSNKYMYFNLSEQSWNPKRIEEA